MTKTHLVLITGTSGSGKSTLGASLRDESGYPLISKDHFKDALMRDAPPANREESKVVGRLSWAAMYAAIDAMIGYVPGLIVDSNFTRGLAEAELEQRIEKCETVTLYCSTQRQIIIERIRSRQNDSSRHAGHFDQDALPGMLKLFDADAFRMTDLNLPTLDVDTTDGYDPSLDHIVAWIRQQV